jgi:hypothetical protein
MSDIPYSVRGSNTSINKVRGFNIGALNNDEMFKRIDANNIGSTNLYVNTVGALGIGANYGISGQILTSNDSGAAPSWNNPTTVFDEVTIDTLECQTANFTGNVTAVNLSTSGSANLDEATIDTLECQTANFTGNVTAVNLSTSGSANLDEATIDTLECQTANFTGNMTISKVGVLDIGGADYGNIGAFLISNGPNSAVTWQEKYFIQAYLPSAFGFRGSGSFSAINNWSVQHASTGASSDMGGQYWTCPQTGIYRISGYLSYLIQGNQDIIQQAHLLVTNSANTAIYIGTQQNNGSDDDDAHITLSFDRMIEFTQNQGFFINVMAITNGASGHWYYIQNQWGSGLSIERIK